MQRVLAAHVRVLFEDRDGDLWIGTNKSGLHLLRDSAFENVRHSSESSAVVKARDNRRSRSRAEAPDEDLWIGTYGGGLARFNRENETFSVMTSRDGLMENVVSRILEDGAGRLWMSGNRGITRLERADAESFLSGELDRVAAILYDEAAGMAVAETNGGNQPAGWLARDGRLWFPTIGGAVAIDPGKLRSGDPPPVAIDTVRVERREVVPRERVLVPPGNRDLEIEYVGLQLGLPGEVAYRYRLVGYDTQWVEVGNRRTAYYTGLDPGIYRFEVTAAAHRGGPWNPQPAALEVEVEPFLWETLWFRAGVVVIALGLVAGAVGWRSASLRNAELEAINTEMERFASTVSHDLKSPLFTIQVFSIS